MSNTTSSVPDGTREIKRRRAPKGEKRREALLDAATTVFSQHGYIASSMRDIAEIAGITTVGLLHHFPNKVALLAAVLERRDRRITKRFAQLEYEPTLASFIEFARVNFAYSLQSREECQAAMMVDIESLGEQHPARVWLGEKFDQTHEHARTHLRQLIDAGEVDADLDVDACATELFAVMDGLQIQWLKSAGAIDAKAVFERYLKGLEQSLRG